MKNQIENSISTIIVAVSLLIVLGCKFSTTDFFSAKKSGNSETTNLSNKTEKVLGTQIIGEWEGLNEGGNPWKINFSSNNTFSSSASGREVMSGTYTVLDEQNIHMKSSKVNDKVQVQIRGNKLTMNMQGSQMVLTRK